MPVSGSTAGAALDATGQHGEAVASYDRALAMRPEYAEAWYNRGIALEKQGRYPDGLDSYDRALAIEPGKCFRVE